MLKEDFLPIPDAPNYEINSQLIVRNKKTGQIKKSKKRIGRKAIVCTVFCAGHEIKRSVKTFRRQAVAAVTKPEKWEPIPSLGNIYEIKRSGKCRNALTKKVKKLRIHERFIGYVFSAKGKSKFCTLKNLLWEVFGIVPKPSHCDPVQSFASKDGVCLKFESLGTLAKFLARKTGKLCVTVRDVLKKRPAEYCGWLISYIKPVDFYCR